MPRVVDGVTRVVYLLWGSFYLLLGVVVLSLGTGLLPVWVRDQVFEIGQNNPETMHLIQEIGTLWVFAGILLFWFAKHYEQSIRFHWAMTFCLLLDAWTHWFTAYGTFEHKPRAIINGIPFFVFLVLGVLRRYCK